MCVLTDPAVHMAIPLYDCTMIITLGKGLSQLIEALLRSVWLPNRIIGTAQEFNSQPLQPLQVLSRHQIGKLRHVCSNVMTLRYAHAGQMSQKVRVDAVEDLAKEGVGGVVEIRVIPAAAEGKVAPMASG